MKLIQTGVSLLNPVPSFNLNSGKIPYNKDLSSVGIKNETDIKLGTKATDRKKNRKVHQ